jgi:low affinity Fe/Cu permease
LAAEQAYPHATPGKDPSMDKHHSFVHFAKAVSRFTGRPTCFAVAVSLIAVWLMLGPAFGFSDTWQLVVNTGTTIITFLMVFVIQNTQNRDTQAMQIKLDELIRSHRGAHNALLDLEELDDAVLDTFRANYERIARAARQELATSEASDGVPDVDAGPQPAADSRRDPP